MGNIIVMGDRIDVNYYRSVSVFSQLDGNLIDCVKFYYYYKIFYVYVGIVYVVYGKLCWVVVDGVFWKNAVCYDLVQFVMSGVCDVNVCVGDFVVVVGFGVIG